MNREVHPEFCDRAGALLLKHRIETIWRARGFEVVIELIFVGFAISLRRAGRYDLRSNMFNGMPTTGAQRSVSPAPQPRRAPLASA